MRQGTVGDCWLLAAMAALAEFPEEVEGLFVSQASPETSRSGQYVVRLFDARANTMRDITVDEFVPCIALKPNQYIRGYEHLAHVPLYAKPNGDIWSLLVEKAMAKMFGSYAALHGGFEAVAFRALTGCTQQEIWERRGSTAEWTNEFLVEGSSNRWRQGGLRSGKQAFWQKLVEHTEAHYLVGTSIKQAADTGRMVEKRRADGLVEGHAYTLLQVTW